MAKAQAFNPYLPGWEYIPDGEPHVYGGRVYVYGSHDFWNGHVFCLGDYVCWSAPVDDLSDWRYEGVIFEKTADPLNREGKMCLYAPDVTRGPDGRYYLYYVYDKVGIVSVAVCDSPAGKYEFLGYVRHRDGTLLGEAPGDEPSFDPAVLTEGDQTYIYLGFCGHGDKSRTGCMVSVLEKDMLTVKEKPRLAVPGAQYSKSTGYEGHAYFEAPSIRKVNGKYYLIYSSQLMHELCYAVSDRPTEGFEYRGVLVSNCDMGVGTYKSADMPSAYGANNHGGIAEISGSWYIFYHRHTNGTWYSRQGCAEPLVLLPDGRFPQVEMTSCGLNGGPLRGQGEYAAYIACNLFTDTPSVYVGGCDCPKIVQDGRDGDEEIGYIVNMKDSATAGFKYFDCKGVRAIRVTTRGYAEGVIEVRTDISGEVLAGIHINHSNIWETESAAIALPDGVHSIYLTYRGAGNAALKSFELCAG